MSSARKRSAIQKANNEADFLRQRLMRAEHHASMMQSFAEVAARRGDALYAAIQKHQAETRYAEVSNTLALADKALYEVLKVGAGDTVPMGSNVLANRRCAPRKGVREMTDKVTTDDSSIDSAASALSAGLGVANCKHCGSKDYTIQLLHVGFRQRILVVECRECRYDLIPVVLDYFMPEAECYTKCREAWNAANETPNGGGKRIDD